MKNIIFILFVFFASTKLFATAQLPDLLIYNNDTIRLYSNPLEAYYNDTNKRPADFGVGGCWSTACWRGYQAIWEIKDKKLYLNSITDCCFWEEYVITDNVIEKLSEVLSSELIEKIKLLKGKEYSDYDFPDILKKNIGKKEYEKNKETIFKYSLKPRQKADLEKLFGEYYKDGKVLAFWFSGDLVIPKGKLVEYVHMGYMSRYEKELVLEIENGILIYTAEYENKAYEIEKGFGLISAISYSLVVPAEIIQSEDLYQYTSSDSINYSNTSGTINITAYSIFNDERKESAKRKILVEHEIDSLLSEMSKQYMFSNKITEKLRWGTACWVDGISNDENERIRIFKMSNINGLLTIYFREKSINEKKFMQRADYILYSVRLLEFGF